MAPTIDLSFGIEMTSAPELFSRCLGEQWSPCNEVALLGLGSPIQTYHRWLFKGALTIAESTRPLQFRPTSNSQSIGREVLINLGNCHFAGEELLFEKDPVQLGVEENGARNCCPTPSHNHAFCTCSDQDRFSLEG